MADREQPRSIRFPQSLWDAIDRDAVRCGRSSVKQMEVLLSAYFGLRQVELDYSRLSLMRGEDDPQGIQVAPRSKSAPIPMLKKDIQKKKRVSK